MYSPFHSSDFSHLLQRLREGPEFPVDPPHVLEDLPLGVEELDALGVRVVAGGEGALDGAGELPKISFLIVIDVVI